MKDGTSDQEHEVIQIDALGRSDSENLTRAYIRMMLGRQDVDGVIEALENQSFDLVSMRPADLLLLLRKIAHDQINWQQHASLAAITNLRNTLEYESRYTKALFQYAPENTANGKMESLFWPNPTHDRYPADKYKTKPFVKKHALIDSDTVISSAGSCFATQLARAFQSRGYNYLVTERLENRDDGVWVDKGAIKGSANFGTLFNTPSLLQIAQKAFGLRSFKKYLVELGEDTYCDPYREGVFFRNKESFLADYDHHVAAIRKLFLESDVFVFTAGVNECWELEDGSVISRNPRNGLHGLLSHKVLTVEQNIRCLETFFEIVKRFNPGLKMILTLSPIPILATGRAMTHHVIEANTHSKAVLRVALDSVVNKNKDIFYFPSYEYVTECLTDVWKDDQRHLKQDAIDKVITFFEEIFCS